MLTTALREWNPLANKEVQTLVTETRHIDITDIAGAISLAWELEVPIDDATKADLRAVAFDRPQWSELIRQLEELGYYDLMGLEHLAFDRHREEVGMY